MKDVYLFQKNGRLYLHAYGKEEPVIKGYESFTGWYWFATSKDVIPKDQTVSGKDEVLYFGLVQGQEEELGYFAESELLALAPKVWEIKEQDLPSAGRRR